MRRMGQIARVYFNTGILQAERLLGRPAVRVTGLRWYWLRFSQSFTER